MGLTAEQAIGLAGGTKQTAAPLALLTEFAFTSFLAILLGECVSESIVL